MKKFNQSGFSPIELVLILVIVSLIGGVGWYVLQQNKTIDSDTTTSVEQGNAEYTNAELGFSFSYPKRFGELKLGPEVDKRRYLEFVAQNRDDLFLITLNQKTIAHGDTDSDIYNLYGYKKEGSKFVQLKPGVPAEAQSQLVIKENELLTSTDNYIVYQRENVFEGYIILYALRKLNNNALYDSVIFTAGISANGFTKDDPVVKQMTDVLNSFKEI